MAVGCPNCGAQNPDEARFCRECGHMFSSATAQPSGPPPPPPPPPPPTEPVAVVPPTEVVPPTQAVPVVPPAPPPPPPGAFAAAAAPAAGAPPAKKKRGGLIVFVALLVLAGIVAGFLLLSGGDDDGGGDILLEPVGFALADDFFGNLDLDTPDGDVEVALDDLPELEDDIEAAGAGKTAPGDLAGLFGGNRGQGVCDVEELASQLDDSDNDEKSAAFSDAVGIDIDDLADALTEMTAVRLRFDTRVTDHSFSSGNAVAQQAILEKGTAVLVDDEGVPRVKCNGGSPLAEPDAKGDLSDDDALDEKVLKNPEDAWDDFDLEKVVKVEQGEPVAAFTVVDIDTGELFDRPVGTNGEADTDVADFDTVCEVIPGSPTCAGEPTTTTTDGGDTTTTTEGTTTTVILGTGDVQVTLEWDSDADLDLAVTDPTGERISFGNRGPTATGGQLDVDSNISCNNNGSIENVFWPPAGAPAGDYLVEVTGFTTDTCSQGAQSGDFVLTIRVAGQPDQVIPGSVGQSETLEFPFSV